jgi:hypothetical protein
MKENYGIPTPGGNKEKPDKFVYIPAQHIHIVEDDNGDYSYADVMDESGRKIANVIPLGIGSIMLQNDNELFFPVGQFKADELDTIMNLDGVYQADEEEKEEQIDATIEKASPNYHYANFDPRINHPKFGEAARMKNQQLAAAGKIMGIEVTVPELAEYCDLGNIDPQHTDRNTDLAAIELAQTIEIPEGDVTFTTIRPDLDSIGSMALLTLRRDDFDFTSEMLNRIKRIADSDKFANGDWPGVRNLPTKQSMYENSDSPSDSETLSAIAAATSDFKVSLEQKVEWLKDWIVSGQEPEGYREQVIAERQKLADALESGDIKINTAKDGSYCVVESGHRAATSLGYTQAPVVVALNPLFKFGDSEPVKKFTISQFKLGYIDLNSALEELNQLEEGWGGSPTIGGSPQGVSSELDIDQVVSVIEKHIIKTK